MFSNKELTIIVPIYNVEKYLRRCIEGLVTQYNGRYLVLLIDDGSTDCSFQIADEYAKKYGFILSFHKRNEGLSSARNFGLAKTTSKYVWFIDSDDYIYKDSIKKIFQAIDGPDFDLYCFGYTTIFSDLSKDFIPNHKIIKYSYGSFIKNYMRYNWSYAVWNKIYRLEIIKKHKINFDNNNEIYSEDIYFNLIYLQYVFNIQFSDNKILNYCLRSDSLYGLSSRLNNLGRFFLLVKRLPLLENNKKYKKYITLHLFRLDNLHYKRTGKTDYASQISKKDRKIIKKNFFDIRILFFDSSLYISCLKIYMSLFHKKLLKFYHLCHLFFAFFCCIRRHISVFFRRRYRIKCYILNILFKKRIVWLIGSEDFGNVGDHLIAITTILFLKETCKNKIILEVPLSDYYDFFPIISKKINQKSLIILSGGGNFGTLYPYAMNAKREICSKLPNKIIIFPQSVFYKNNNDAIKDKKIFSKSNIYLFLRDQISYNFSKQNITNNSFLCSDITLYIENILTKAEKKFDVLLCLRHDKERMTNDFFINSVKNELNKNEMSFTEFDTQFSNDFSIYSRNKIIKKTFKIFNECSYVITDRLHGCIISLLCKKPVIVIDNSYKKISGFLDTLEIENGVWLANLNSFPKILNVFNNKPNPPKYKIKQNFDKLRKTLLDK